MLSFFLFLLLSGFTEFGVGVEDAVSNQTEMGHDISLHTKEVNDEEEEALLHIQTHGQACAQHLDTVPVPDSSRQSPKCLKILSVLRNYFQFPLSLPPLSLSLELSCAPSIFSWLLGLLFPNDDAISFRVGDSS